MSHAELPITEMLTPSSAEDVAQAVRSAREKRLAVYPIGGGTMAHMGIKPTRPGLGISLAGLNRIVEHSVDDLTITVEAGVTIAQLTEVLASQHQRLPVDIVQPELATIGGAVAVNAAGPRRYGYGTLRDYVLGFTAVDGAGMIFTGGGRVVKNAAGYNMPRLMAGSHGTLGILTQITLMVRPVCEASVLVVCDIPTLAAAERLLDSLVRSSVRPVAIEFMAGKQRESDFAFGPMLQGQVGRLYVGFEGTNSEVDWMADRLCRDWTESHATAPMLVPTPRAMMLWPWLAEVPRGRTLRVLPSQTIAAIGELLESNPNSLIQAHAGDGVIHTNLEAIETPSVESKPVTPTERISRSIRDRFDPDHLLNPDR